MHYERTAASLKQGLRAVRETMTCTVQHAKRLIALARNTKRVLISYQRHYIPNSGTSGADRRSAIEGAVRAGGAGAGWLLP